MVCQSSLKRPRPMWFVVACLWFVSPSLIEASEPTLDLATAERIALANDPAVASLRLRARALAQRAVAAAQRPDPKLKFGSAALPLDTFDLDQEPMTQLQLGFQQRFPSRTQLNARREQFSAGADVLEQLSRDTLETVRRDLRDSFIEVVYQQQAQTILGRSRAILTELINLATDYYAAGRASQLDVYRAELERSRLDERIARFEQSEQEARARMAVWLNQRANDSVAASWPGIDAPPAETTLLSELGNHPQLIAMTAKADAANAAIDVARGKTKPGWMLDVTYGDRSGMNLDGSRRADFISAMVTIDLPLFTANRQDREISASSDEAAALESERSHLHRQLASEVRRLSARHSALEDRLQLFEQRLLPDASAHREASLEAYQSGAGDMTALMRAQIIEYELQLDQARLEADQLQARARLWYLAGVSS